MTPPPTRQARHAKYAFFYRQYQETYGALRFAMHAMTAHVAAGAATL
jgi:hypothetical protein